MNTGRYPALFRGSPEEAQTKIALLEMPDAFIEYYSQFSGVPIHLQDFQRTMLKELYLQQKLVLLVPAGFGKSTLIKWYVVHQVCLNPNVRIILVMKNDEEVKTYAKSIRQELVGNHQLIKDFGPFHNTNDRDSRWSDDAIEVHARQITEPQPTVEFSSASIKAISQILGHRCDIALLDDVVTPETVNTQKWRDRQAEIFQNGIETGPQYLWDLNLDYDPSKPSTLSNRQFLTKPEHIWWPEDIRPYDKPVVYEKLVIDGTVFHPDDLFHRKGRSPQDMQPGRLYKGRDPTYKVLYFDCFKHDENNVALEESIWPERRNIEWLHEKERSVGTLDFNRRYRNIAIDEGSLFFQRSWIYGDKEAGLKGVLEDGLDGRGLRSWGELPYDTLNDRNVQWYKILGFDPSTGRMGADASFAAMVLLAVDLGDPEKIRYVIDILRAQIEIEDQLSHVLTGDARRGIEGFYSRYTYNKLCIEQTSWTKIFTDHHRMREARSNLSFEWQGIETQAATKISMVSELQPLLLDGKLRIPYATASDREKAQDFIEQLLLYPEGKQDYPMALAFANRGVALQSQFKAFCPGPGRYIANPHYVR